MLGVFAKAPDIDPVKTRLLSTLSQEQVRSFYVASLADTLESAVRVDERPTLFLATGGRHHCAPDVLTSLRTLLLSTGMEAETWNRLRFEGQVGADLGARMQRAFETLCMGPNGPRPAILIGSDSPALGPERIARGRALLECSHPGEPAQYPDLVLGPAADGGYYLIGVRQFVPDLLSGVHWSSARTLEETLERALQLGLQVTLLETWTDVDRPEDLRQLAAQITRIRAGGDLGTARHSEKFLRSLAPVP
jgi:rSAM/selenodomain-associated transferase 1